MTFLTIDEIARNARVEDWAVSEEQPLLQAIGDTAERMVFDLLDRTADDLLEQEGGTLPGPVHHAMVMLATHLYEHRAPLTTGSIAAVPYTIDAMLKPYIKF